MSNRLRPLVLAAIAFATPASAYTIIDGSGESIDPATLATVLEAVSDQLLDPGAAQFRHIRISKRPDMICGEINAKNGYGAYVGFQPFYSLGIDRASLPPPQIGGISADCR